MGWNESGNESSELRGVERQLWFQALESEFVSSQLHLWIDLIFGARQLGQAAVDAVNTFHPYFYADTLDADSLRDPLKKSTILGFVSNFGQIPRQVPEPRSPIHRSIRYSGTSILCSLHTIIHPYSFVILYSPHSTSYIHAHTSTLIHPHSYIQTHASILVRHTLQPAYYIIHPCLYIHTHTSILIPPYSAAHILHTHPCILVHPYSAARILHHTSILCTHIRTSYIHALHLKAVHFSISHTAFGSCGGERFE